MRVVFILYMYSYEFLFDHLRLSELVDNMGVNIIHKKRLSVGPPLKAYG